MRLTPDRPCTKTKELERSCSQIFLDTMVARVYKMTNSCPQEGVGDVFSSRSPLLFVCRLVFNRDNHAHNRNGAPGGTCRRRVLPGCGRRNSDGVHDRCAASRQPVKPS